MTKKTIKKKPPNTAVKELVRTREQEIDEILHLARRKLQYGAAEIIAARPPILKDVVFLILLFLAVNCQADPNPVLVRDV
jgi:hypothetical protein